MLRLAGFILFAALIEAQGWKDLLLPQPKHVSGVVVDQKGKPVPGAQIYHADIRTPPIDGEGRFDFDLKAPAIVIRKLGFQSVFLRTADSAGVRVILKPLAPRIIPTCPAKGKYDGIEGWGGLLKFPRISSVHATEQGRDSDYAARNYITKVGRKAAGIRHGAGPMWSAGVPSNMDVWPSIEYEESSAIIARQNIIDARGVTAEGLHWRYLGKFGESADYSGIEEASARILDQFLDGTCVKGAQR